jgi:hypothetical protein
MSENLVSLLDRLLTRLRAGESVEDILADYPARREQLGSLLWVAQALAPLRAEPRPTQAEARFAQFVADAHALHLTATMRRRPRRRLSVRGAALAELWRHPRLQQVVATVVALVTLCVFTATAIALAAHSLPGDLLFPVKLAAEELELSFSADPTARAEYCIARAQTRAEEIGRLARLGRPVTEAALERLDRALEAGLNAVAMADAAHTQSLLAPFVEMTGQQAGRIAAQAVTVHQQSLRDGLEQAALALTQAQSLAQSGQVDPFTFRLDGQFGFLMID